MGARQPSGASGRRPGPPARTQPNRLGLLLAAVAFVLFLEVGRAVGGWLFGPAAPGGVPTVPTVAVPTATPVPRPHPAATA